jgi:hypothetical protein
MTVRDANGGVNRIVTMLQTGIGVEDEGLTYNDLTRLERDITAAVREGRMSPESALKVAHEVRKILTEQGLQRFDDYVNGKVARDNLIAITDGAADGRSGAQLEQRLNGRAARATVAIREYDGPVSGLLEVSQRLTEQEGRGEIDPITSAQLRQALDTRLAEEVARGGLRIAPPQATWEAFQGRTADNEARRTMAERAVVGVQPRDVLLRPQEFTPVLRTTLESGRIPLRDIGALSAEAAEAQRRGQLTPAERTSVDRAIDASLRNERGVLDPRSTVSSEAALANVGAASPVRTVLGAVPAHERTRVSATAEPSVAKGDQRTFRFDDPQLAQRFVHALARPNAVSASQRDALVESVLQRGALSLGELRAFQIAMDEAVAAKLVTAQDAQAAWKVMATQAARYVGGSRLGATLEANEIAAHGTRRFRG